LLLRANQKHASSVLRDSQVCRVQHIVPHVIPESIERAEPIWKQLPLEKLWNVFYNKSTWFSRLNGFHDDPSRGAQCVMVWLVATSGATVTLARWTREDHVVTWQSRPVHEAQIHACMLCVRVIQSMRVDGDLPMITSPYDRCTCCNRTSAEPTGTSE
jgi:hypothetical protein